MPPTCLDLQETFGSRYRIEFEESYYAERSRQTVDDPWLQIIPCRFGHIYPQGGEMLAAATKRRGRTATMLRQVPGVEVRQDGSDGINVVFPVDLFPAVAAIMRPHRRAVLTDEQKATARELLAAYAFKPRCLATCEAQTGLPTPHVDTLPVPTA